MGDMQDEINSMKLQIGLIERDIVSLSKVSEKISKSIEKIQELNVNFVKMITISEQRHTVHDDIEDDLKVNIKDVDAKLSKLNLEINDRLAQFELQVLTKLESLKDELGNITMKGITNTTFKDYFQTKYMVIGGAAVIGWVIGHISDIAKFLDIIK